MRRRSRSCSCVSAASCWSCCLSCCGCARRGRSVAGVLLHAGYIGGVWCAIRLGMPAGLSALIVGMQPVLTAVCAPLIGEAVRGRQWVGLLIGLCGVALVVASKMTVDVLPWQSIALCIFGLLSITSGTLYQKRYCAHFDLRTGTLIQFTASALVLLPFAIALDGLDWQFSIVHWHTQFIAALAWAVFALSIGAIFLLFSLIRRSAATEVTSLLYLTPPTTAVMAWLCFGETFSLFGLAGMALALAGVVLVMKKQKVDVALVEI